MTEGIIIAIITAGCSLIGVVVTVIYGNKKITNTVKSQTDLTLYRISELEKKQNKHNSVIERVFKLEQEMSVIKKELSVENHRIKDLEEFHKPKD